jgi:tRNA (guanine-N7-)-methyltransferase
MSNSHPPLRSYGRIKARSLKPSQERLMGTLLPQLAIDPAAPPPADVLEIGFGGGEHLAAQAAARPDLRFIGVEPFMNGVGSCLRHIEEAGLTNVALHMGDARDVLAAIPDASLLRVDILFPDPWPKARHHKRRLIQPAVVAEIARVLKPGGEVRFATDWANYAAHALEYFIREPRLAWCAERAADWKSPWEGHVPTRYEEKKLGDCAPVWLRFVREDVTA